MTEKSEKIVSVASDLFMRYGYHRVTMSDIARGASISRPALYLVFPGKEEIFHAVVVAIERDARARLLGEIEQFADMRARLLHVCQNWFLNLYDLQNRAPDARDMDDLAFPVVRDVYARLQGLLESILTHGAEEQAADIDAVTLARILIFSIRGFRASVENANDYRALITVQVDIVADAVRAARTPTGGQ